MGEWVMDFSPILPLSLSLSLRVLRDLCGKIFTHDKPALRESQGGNGSG
jgi:hypothetical protein